MKVNEIERLLARYYDGETSETEEKELKRFFTEEDIPAHLLAEKEIFMQLAAQPAPEIPEGLESRLSRKIVSTIPTQIPTTTARTAYFSCRIRCSFWIVSDRKSVV